MQATAAIVTDVQRKVVSSLPTVHDRYSEDYMSVMLGEIAAAKGIEQTDG